MDKSPQEILEGINNLISHSAGYLDSILIPSRILIPDEQLIFLLMKYEGWTREEADFYLENLPEE